MTCIVGIVGVSGPEQGKVLLGGDSAAFADGQEIHSLHNAKVFRKGPYAFGYTTSFRMGQILHFGAELPEPPAIPAATQGKNAPFVEPGGSAPGWSSGNAATGTAGFEAEVITTKLEAFLATEFAEALRHAFANHHYEHPLGEAGSLVVGVHGRLFVLGKDFQVLAARTPFVAVGCGRLLAYGALAALDRLDDSAPLELETRARLALESAARFSPGVTGPFRFVSI